VAVVPDEPALAARLALDPRTAVVADPAAADVVWLLPGAGPAELFRHQARGRVVLAGPHSDLRPLGVAIEKAASGPADLPVDLVGAQEREVSSWERLRRLVRGAPPTVGPAPLLATAIAWRSAPKARTRVILGPGGPGQVAVRARDEGPVILQAERLVIIGLQLFSPDNDALLRWGYGNYLLHAATFLAAGRAPEPFHAWPAAPVPQRTARTLWTLFLVAVWPLSIIAFLLARRAARRDGGAAVEPFFTALSRSAPAHREEGGPRAAGWLRAGFERPLGGFFVMTGALFVFIAPYVLVVQFILPTYVQRFPEVDGMWNSVYESLYWVWVLFDMGTSVAFVKYFADLRTRDPAQALASVQFYTWWQLLTGAVQVTLVGILGVFVVPRTEYALFSHLVALYGLSQWPGVFYVMVYFFQAAQRQDYSVALDLLQNRFLLVAAPIPFVLLGRHLGARYLPFGEGMGAVFGTAVGYYTVGLVVLVISYLLYRRLGVGLRPLFLAGFTRETIRRDLGFGWKITIVGLSHKLSWSIETWMLLTLLYSYNEVTGFKNLIDYKFFFLFGFLYGWYEPAVATVSEAHGAGKLQLVRYYVARYLQIGHLYVAIFFSFLVALAPLLISRALDPRWSAAAALIFLASTRALLYPAVWVIDATLRACGRPGLNAILLVVEQAARLMLLWLLIPKYQLAGVFVAMLLTLILKTLIGWLMISRAITRLILPAYPLVIAPLLAGLANYLLWHGAAGLLSAAGRFEVVAVTLLSGVLSFPICFFLCGLFSGFDRKALTELLAGAGMASGFRGASRLLARAAQAGARLAPWPCPFPQALSDDAEREAREIDRRAEAAAHAV
jgi:O-antigen/teichoic acid export membrane protein